MDTKAMATRLAREFCDSYPNHSFCHHNLGVPRTQMPQIRDRHKADFMEWLGEHGYAVRNRVVPVGYLKSTQGNLISRYIDRVLADDPRQLGNDKPMLASADGYIIDGHHRWAALIIVDPEFRVPIIEVGAPIRTLLKLLEEYPNTEYSSVTARCR